MAGALTLLDELQAGIKIAIAQKKCSNGCGELGIADRVDAIADGYSVQHPKPAPTCFCSQPTS